MDGSDSHLCVMIGASLALSQSVTSHYHPCGYGLSIVVTNLLIGRAIFLLATGSSPHADSCLPTSSQSPWFTWLNERKSNLRLFLFSAASAPM